MPDLPQRHERKARKRQTVGCKPTTRNLSGSRNINSSVAHGSQLPTSYSALVWSPLRRIRDYVIFVNDASITIRSN
jgi:hypothetical protein